AFAVDFAETVGEEFFGQGQGFVQGAADSRHRQVSEVPRCGGAAAEAEYVEDKGVDLELGIFIMETPNLFIDLTKRLKHPSLDTRLTPTQSRAQQTVLLACRGTDSLNVNFLERQHLRFDIAGTSGI